MGEHTKKEQPAEKKRKLEDSRWVTVRSYEIDQEEKKQEDIDGKKNREIYKIKKYLVTKNHPRDKNGQEMEEPIEYAELACKPENAGLACKPENAGLACIGWVKNVKSDQINLILYSYLY